MDTLVSLNYFPGMEIAEGGLDKGHTRAFEYWANSVAIIFVQIYNSQMPSHQKMIAPQQLVGQSLAWPGDVRACRQVDVAPAMDEI